MYVIDRLLRQGISLPEGKHQRKNQADEKPTRAYSGFRTQYPVLEQWKAVGYFGRVATTMDKEPR